MTTRNPPPPAPARKLTVWPYFFFGGVAALLGLVFVVGWWPASPVTKADLVKISGTIDRVSIRDDISGTSAGAVMPGLTSVFYTLEEVEGEFRYPHSHPQYLKVRDYTSVAIDVWVDPAEMDAGEVMTIWQIRENNPYDDPEERTFVSYEEIVERLTGAGWSMVQAGAWLLAGAAAAFAVGFVVVRRNRGRIAS